MEDNEKIISEEVAHLNPLLTTTVEGGESEIKTFLVNYAGEKLHPEDDRVTVHMIAEMIAAEFPEFMFAIAEENFLRGYQLGLEDATPFTEETEAAAGNEE